MSNPFYSYSGAFIPGTLARAEQVATEYAAVQAGFALLAYQGTDSGIANAYVVTTPGAPTGAYADGQLVQFKALNANTGPSTINVNGLGVVSLLRSGGSGSQAGDITANTWFTAAYNSTFSAWTIITPVPVTGFTNTISGAAPPNKVGLVAAGGVALAALPVDATFAIDQSISPTWTGTHIFSGNVTFNANVSFSGAFGFTGTSGHYAQTLTGFAGTGVSFGQKINAGTNASDIALLVASQAATTYFQVDGAGSVTVGTPTGGGQGVGTINAAGLFINGVSVLTSGSTGANPTGTVGLTAVNGSATTFLRSDGAPPLSQAISPTWTAAHTFTPGSAVTAVTINAAINTQGLAVQGGTNTANTYLVSFATALGSGFSSGLLLKAGTTSADNALLIQNAATTATYAQIKGDGSGSVGYNGTTAVVTWDVNGHVTFAAPTAGGQSGFTFDGRTGNAVAAFLQAAGSGAAFGVIIKGGTTSADYALLAQTQGGTDIFRVRGDGTILGQGPVAGANVDMTPDAGTFTMTLHAGSNTYTGTAIFSRNGNQVTLFFPAVSGLAAGTTLTATGLPASLQTARTLAYQSPASFFINNNANVTGFISFAAGSGTITFGNGGPGAAWATSGNPNGIATAFTITYLLN